LEILLFAEVGIDYQVPGLAVIAWQRHLIGVVILQLEAYQVGAQNVFEVALLSVQLPYIFADFDDITAVLGFEFQLLTDVLHFLKRLLQLRVSNGVDNFIFQSLFGDVLFLFSLPQLQLQIKYIVDQTTLLHFFPPRFD
jgi:hypothetical protein